MTRLGLLLPDVANQFISDKLLCRSGLSRRSRPLQPVTKSFGGLCKTLPAKVNDTACDIGRNPITQPDGDCSGRSVTSQAGPGLGTVLR